MTEKEKASLEAGPEPIEGGADQPTEHDKARRALAERCDAVVPGLFERLDMATALANGLYDVHVVMTQTRDRWVNGERNDKQHTFDLWRDQDEFLSRCTRLFSELREAMYCLENAATHWRARIVTGDGDA